MLSRWAADRLHPPLPKIDDPRPVERRVGSLVQTAAFNGRVSSRRVGQRDRQGVGTVA
jgi:hypothetical protein